MVAGGVVAVRVGREEDERDTAPAQLREPVARQAVQVEGEQGGVDLPAARGLQHLVRAQAAPGDGEGDRQRALGVGEAGEEDPLALRIAQPGGQADEPGQRIDAPGRPAPGRGRPEGLRRRLLPGSGGRGVQGGGRGQRGAAHGRGAPSGGKSTTSRLPFQRAVASRLTSARDTARVIATGTAAPPRQIPSPSAPGAGAPAGPRRSS